MEDLVIAKPILHPFFKDEILALSFEIQKFGTFLDEHNILQDILPGWSPGNV